MEVLLTIFWCWSSHTCTPILSSVYPSMKECEQSAKERLDKATHSRSSYHNYSCILFIPGKDIRK
jgi:hypothetical protein